ncbi:MAG TPA: S41 family peptidase [Bryobacteraceae bacterium]|nr:S41 family peptidase [Bryobacteraceae bacterium]
MRNLVCGICAVSFIGCAAAQENPVLSQFERLMGQPKSLAASLVDLPWNAEPPETLPGFQRKPHGQTIRVVSVERPLEGASQWTHWESEDHLAWVDLVRFSTPYGASQLLQTARQPHSGYHWANQLLLFSGTGDLRKEAVGTTLIGSNGTLLNVGLQLPLEVHWDRPLPADDRTAFDATLTRFQSTLEMLARTMLDPAYVSVSPKIEPKPEALPILRMTGFARLWSYVKYNFVYLDQRPDVNWESVLDRYMPRIAAAKDDEEYGRILQQAVALLKDGHTGVFPNAVARQDAPAIVLEPIQGKPVATIVGKLAELSAIQPGMELLSIDGTPVATIIERDLDPYIFSSTVQDRQLRQMRMLLQGAPGSQARTRWRAADGKEVEVTLSRNGSQNRGALQDPSHPRFERKDLDNNVAYIGLSDFNNPAVDKEFEAAFDKLREAKAWIIDLRWNGGGSSGIGNQILAHFIDRPLQGSAQRTRLYNPTFEAWGRPQSWHDFDPDKIEPAAGPHYEGPVYVLTSPNTCSAAEDFLIPLKMAKRITIVGEPTCGSTGQPLQFSIYGATARVCTKWDRFPDGTEFVGVGVLPDVKAARTPQDVVTGRDVVLEKAIELASHSASK